MTNPGTNLLKAWWKLDEASGQTRLNAWDDSGVLALFDINTVGRADDLERSTFSGGCADLGGPTAVNSLRSLDSLGYLRPGNNSFSVGLWVKHHNVAQGTTILSKWDASATLDREYILGNHPNGKARWEVHDGTSSYVKYCDGVYMVDNKWYFVVAYYDAITNLIKVGTNDVWSSLAGPIGGIDLTNADFYLGRSQNGSYGDFDGLLDDAFFYNGRLLTPAEWTWLYNYGQGRRYEDLAEEARPTITVQTTEPVIPIVHVFDETLTRIGVIDDYYSLNWAERFNTLGDFELDLPIEYVGSPLMDFGNFLYIETSDKIMIVEEKKPSVEIDKASLVVNGRSAESILERRVLLEPITWPGTAEHLVYKVVKEHIRDPVDAERKIGLFDTANAAIWPPAMLATLRVTEQFDIQDVYSVVEDLCKRRGLGFKIVVEDLDADDSELYFYVYGGVDRSMGQSDNTWVIFADSLDNILKSSFYSSELEKVNTAYVVTDDAVYPTRFTWIGVETTGLNRFEGSLETTVDRDSDGDDVDDLTDGEVLDIIRFRGQEIIELGTPVGVFEGDFETRGVYVYNVHFFMGDIVQCVLHGQDVAARVIELVRSYGVDGEKVYLAFDFLV